MAYHLSPDKLEYMKQFVKDHPIDHAYDKIYEDIFDSNIPEEQEQTRFFREILENHNMLDEDEQ